MAELNRRKFLTSVGLGAGALGLPVTSNAAPTVSKKPVLMKAGHQRDHSDATLQALAAFGVNHICSGDLGKDMEKWSVASLTQLKKRIESFGITLAAVPLPMEPSEISHADLPDILLAKE